MEPQIVIEPEWVGKSGQVFLRVKADGEILDASKINITVAEKRENFIKTLLKAHPGLDEQFLRGELLKLAAGWSNIKNSKPEAEIEENTPLAKSKTELAKMNRQTVEEARQFLRRPDLLEQIIEHVHQLGSAGEDDLIGIIYLIGTSRLLERPLAGMVMGASAAGKSYLLNTVGKLFPGEAILSAHRITARALEHTAEHDLEHRFLMAGERSRLQDDGAAEATRALREMLADGKLTLMCPEKGPDGRMETRIIERWGPIAYAESTTLGLRDIFDEDRTRMILLAADETRAQTKAVLATQAATAAGNTLADQGGIIELHHAMQRLLEPQQVIVPYAPQLAEAFLEDRVEARRSFVQVLSFIQAVCLLYQFQRVRNAHGELLAIKTDYEICRKLLAEPIGRGLGLALTPGAMALLDHIDSRGGSGYFTIPTIAGELKLADSTVRGRVKELVHAGFVQEREKAKGPTAATYGRIEGGNKFSAFTLPLLDDKAQVLENTGT